MRCRNTSDGRDVPIPCCSAGGGRRRSSAPKSCSKDETTPPDGKRPQLTRFGSATRPLIFLEERACYHRSGFQTPQDILLGAGHRESRLLDREEDDTCRVLLRLLRECRSYHFHDTSSVADVRRHLYIGDNRYLRADAGNLAAYLHLLERTRPDAYRRIVDAVRLVFPAFADFSLAPSPTNNQEIVLDEPELGLHPYAINVLGAMVRAAATQVQVVLATQSPRLVDEFEPGDIVVLGAEAGSGTKCHRPNPGKLAA